MKTWNETREVLTLARNCLAAGQPCAIVILTNVKGSAFRRPGAKLLIQQNGEITGNVSGGCLENDLRERAAQCIAAGVRQIVHYNTGSDEDVIWGLGLGCDGELDLLIEPLRQPAPWIESALDKMAQKHLFSLSWPLESGTEIRPRLILERDIPDAREFASAYLDVLIPPRELFVVGAGDDAVPLVALAAEAGFHVTVIDHRPGYLSTHRFPRAANIVHARPESATGLITANHQSMVVIKNHALEMDKKWAAFFDAGEVSYIGILGPRKRTAQIRDGMKSGKAGRIFGPAGLDIGAEGAEQIAISIVAELLTVAAQRQPIHLREREGSIHGTEVSPSP
ncbi:MAG TPA: XdhC family protein [Kiritimatiellia bacterium]|nr:XdhC family protein [Kiritimatiellia bacterium]